MEGCSLVFCLSSVDALGSGTDKYVRIEAGRKQIQRCGAEDVVIS